MPLTQDKVQQATSGGGQGRLLRLSAVLAIAVAVASLPLDATRANPRPVAQGLARVLSGGGPHPAPSLKASLLGLDASLVELDTLIQGPTFLFYFSSTCPHCQAVAPELERLGKRLEGRVAVLGIASGSNGLSQIREFTKSYGLSFPVYKDTTRRFASSNAAASTPILLFVRPQTEGSGFETLGSFRPFSSGHSLPAEIQARALLGEDPWQAFEPGHYSGPIACGSCHEEEYKSWGLTHHSKAYWTLYEAKKIDDAKCVGCHVTGMGEPNGYVFGDHQSPHTDVGCEACHGPGGPHDGQSPDPSEATSVCTSCHDAEHSLRFDLARGLPGIDHFRSVGMDAEAFRLAREAMLDGSAPKPLLAFPQGKTLGPTACKSCHEAQFRKWKKGPHASAMKTLQAKGSGADPSCISCHAVKKTEEPQTPADYHDEGVSCEACHGPGEEHVAAKGGTENIVGLGDTCPMCVIEALCTTCHTPSQDPDWDLDEGLKAVRH